MTPLLILLRLSESRSYLTLQEIDDLDIKGLLFVMFSKNSVFSNFAEHAFVDRVHTAKQDGQPKWETGHIMHDQLLLLSLNTSNRLNDAGLLGHTKSLRAEISVIWNENF
jgi:hypothetical protein